MKLTNFRRITDNASKVFRVYVELEISFPACFKMHQINVGKILSLIGLTSLLTLSPILSSSLLAEELKQGLPGRRFGGALAQVAL